jgi:anaerobic selenocysteine-containing dehydrogenase
VLSRRDVVFMAPEDAAAGLAAGDRVVVETGTGCAGGPVVPAPIRARQPRDVLPEASIVPRRLDARSRRPAFKS